MNERDVPMTRSLSRPRQVRRRRRGRWRLLAPVLLAAAALVAIYAGGAMLAGAWFVDRAVQRAESRRPGLSVEVGSVRVHPFRWSARLGPVYVHDTHTGEFVFTPELVLELHTDSLPKGRLRLRRLLVVQPHVAIIPPPARRAALPAEAAARDAFNDALFNPSRLLRGVPDVPIDELVIDDGRLVAPRPPGAPARDVDALMAAQAAPGADASAGGFTFSARQWPGSPDAPAAYRLDLRAARAPDDTFTESSTDAPADMQLVVEGELLGGETLMRGRVRLSGFTPGAFGGWQDAAGDLFAISAMAGMLDATGEFRAVRADAPGGTARVVMDLELRGRFSAAGPATVSMTLDSADPVDPAFLYLRLNELPAGLLSRYTEQEWALPVRAGRGEVLWQYRRDGSRIDGQLDLQIADLALESSDETPPTPASGPHLAIALLEDARQRIALSVPVAADLAAGQTPADAAGQALRATLSAVVDAPFTTLATATDNPSLTDSLHFTPGEAAATAATDATIAALARALAMRPRLGLELDAPYDPELDRQHLAERQVELHVTLATAGAEFGARTATVDFASPRVHDVLEEFAGERLDAGQLAGLRTRFGFEPAQVPDAAPTAYYRAVFDALAASERIDAAAMERLARFRAQAAIASLADAGIARERLRARAPAVVSPAQRQWFYVPASLQLVAVRHVADPAEH